jgi:hypothetical protein
VAAGDLVTALGTPAELDAAGLVWHLTDRSSRRPAALRPGLAWPEGQRPDSAPVDLMRYLIGTIAGAADRRLRAAVTVLTASYSDSRGGMTVLDALYFTVETIGTVGYGDFSFRDQKPWLRVFAICLMILGASLATVFFALLTNTLVSRRIEEQLGRRRVPGMTGHVVVVGVGSIGIRVVEGLLRRAATWP